MPGQPATRGFHLSGRHRQLPLRAQAPGRSAPAGLCSGGAAGRARRSSSSSSPATPRPRRPCRSCRPPSVPPSWAWSCPEPGRPCRRLASAGWGCWPPRRPCARTPIRTPCIRLDAGLEVFAIACPRLAPLIQGGDVFSEEIEGAAREATAPLKAAGVDTVILGCTHYPLISPMLRRLLGPHVSLINSAEETAREVGEILDPQDPRATTRTGRASIVFSQRAIPRSSERSEPASCNYPFERWNRYDQGRETR